MPSKFKRKRSEPIAHAGKDRRYTVANKINNMCLKCCAGKEIQASQQDSVVSITCGCGISMPDIKCGGIIDEHDVLAEFNDFHPQLLNA